MDDDFLAEIEAAAEEWRANFIFVCTEVDKRDILISESKVPDTVCSCPFGDRSSRYAFMRNEKKHYIHVPCGKVSRFSVWHYCFECYHLYFDDRSGKGQDTVNGSLCPCCDRSSNGSVSTN